MNQSLLYAVQVGFTTGLQNTTTCRLLTRRTFMNAYMHAWSYVYIARNVKPDVGLGCSVTYRNSDS